MKEWVIYYHPCNFFIILYCCQFFFSTAFKNFITLPSCIWMMERKAWFTKQVSDPSMMWQNGLSANFFPFFICCSPDYGNSKMGSLYSQIQTGVEIWLIKVGHYPSFSPWDQKMDKKDQFQEKLFEWIRSKNHDFLFFPIFGPSGGPNA